MAVEETVYLRIRKGEYAYLLLKSPSHFHLIRVDASLTESVMNRLLRIYPCDANRLRQLGVHFSAFRTASLRHIVINGYQAGDPLQLWIGAGVRDYRLDSDYTEAAITGFFSGYPVTYRLPPKWNGLNPVWIRRVTWSINIGSVVCALLFYFLHVPYKLWCCLCVLCQLAALVLPLIYPDSFTLADESRKSKRYINKRKGHLLTAFIVPGFALALRTLVDFTFVDNSFWLFFPISLVATALCAISFWRSGEFQNCLLNAVGVVMAVTILGSGTVGQLNYLLEHQHADSETVTVIDKRISNGRRADHYYCTVELPDGEAVELSLPARTYRNIEIGDDVVVTHHDGVFDIPFYTVEILPDG